MLASIALLLSANAFTAPGENGGKGSNANGIATQAELDAVKADVAGLRELINKMRATKKVGDLYGGGIVIYVDEFGQSGLIVSLSDLTDYPVPWYNGANKVVGAAGDGFIGAGVRNTEIIVADQVNDNPSGIFAAKVAADFSVQEDGVSPCTGAINEICHGDWYLPSKYELNLLAIANQRGLAGDIADDSYYWSSTESGRDSAWSQFFLPPGGMQSPESILKSSTVRVRAVRRF